MSLDDRAAIDHNCQQGKGRLWAASTCRRDKTWEFSTMQSIQKTTGDETLCLSGHDDTY